MGIFMKAIGLLWILESLAYLLHPAILQHLLRFLRYGRRFRFVGAVNLTIGILFLTAASKATAPGIIMTIGVVLSIGSLLVLVHRSDEKTEVIEWCQEQPANTIRAIAVAGVFVGLLVYYAG